MRLCWKSQPNRWLCCDYVALIAKIDYVAIIIDRPTPHPWFEYDFMRKVIWDNINPIEKVTKTLLLLGCTINEIDTSDTLSTSNYCERLIASFPEIVFPR